MSDVKEQVQFLINRELAQSQADVICNSKLTTVGEMYKAMKTLDGLFALKPYQPTKETTAEQVV